MQKSSSHYESILNATQGRMIWLRFKKHKIAVLSLVLLLILYVVSIFAEFFTPYDIEKRFPGFENAEPSTIYLFDENNEYLGFHFYEFKKTVDRETFEVKFIEDRNFLLNNINDFFKYNLNQSTLLRSIENRFSNE